MIISSKSQIFAILIACLTFVLLYFAPKKPAVSEDTVEVNTTAVDDSISYAVSLITGGQEPMKGILMLRELADKNPELEEAQFYLGVFSMQSSQFEKAIDRFKKVININPNNDAAYYFLGQSLEQLGDIENAKINYNLFLSRSSDDARKDEIKKHLENL
jgi:tetratricopeptide (TPR) repeat protein